MSPQKITTRQLINLIKNHPFTTASILLWITFFSAYWLNAYQVIDGAVYAKSLATWADGAVHLTYISSMAYQPTFPKFLPVFLGEPFFYPFLADALAAILVRLGLNIFAAYAYLGLFLSLILIFSLYYFYLTLTQKPTTASLSLNLTLASGGLGFYYFFLDKLKDGFDFTQPILKEYTLLDDYGIYWLNIITGELLPQRPFLLGMIFGLVILTILWKFVFHQSTSTWKLFLAGCLFGLLPITHPHTLLVLTVVIGWFFILSLIQKTHPKSWLYFIVPALALGLPLIYSFILPKSGSFIRFYLGWMAQAKNINIFWFWFINWGLLPILTLLGYRHASSSLKQLLLPTIIVFALANLFLFQPYDWDNAKIFTWVYLFLTPFAATWLAHQYSKYRLTKVLIMVIVFTLTASGAIDLVRQLTPHTTIQMFPQTDLQLAQAVKQQLPADATFVTSDYHLHPIPTLTGRQILSGYPGWLWSYGLNYSQREEDITEIYSGSPKAQKLLSKYGIDYVVIGPHEYSRYNPNLEFFTDNFPVALSQDSYQIFQTN